MPRILLLANARSGSCYLEDLLNCHPEISLSGEILNNEFGLVERPLETISETLAKHHNTYVGFKLFPEQLYDHGLHFGKLVESLGISHVIILWRENLLESYVSQQIAITTNIWYPTTEPTPINKVLVDVPEFKNYVRKVTQNWKQIGLEWSAGLRPIYVKFEDLIKQPTIETKRILAEMSLVSENHIFITPSVRQNPAPVSEKVLNYLEIPEELRQLKLDVRQLLSEKHENSIEIPAELPDYYPDREPCMPAGGWLYTVAEPYLPANSMQYAFDALQSGSISSAGYWPKKLAKRLRKLFQFPVAQPCSSGFTALLLAMQVSDIGLDDEVILPSMTMVAVANAVHYLRAVPIFADNANKTAYNPNWQDYLNRASPKNKAVIVTHTYGIPVADIELIAKECESRDWILIEDISQCVGMSCTNSKGENQLLGTFGHFACASLYVNKIVHGGDGGFVVAKDAKVGKRLQSITNHGFTQDLHFVHFEPALNAKIHGIGAAIATGCFENIKTILKHRSELAKWYRECLEALPTKQMPQCGPEDMPWVFGIECESKQQRTDLREFLAKSGIETRDYFFPLHLQPTYMHKVDKTLDFANCEYLSTTGCYVPTHTNMKEVDVKYICQMIKAYFSQESLETDMPEQRNVRQSVQIVPNSFAVQVRKYRSTGEIRNIFNQNHSYITAVQLGLKAEELLLTERYDKVLLLIKAMQKELTTVIGDPMEPSMQKYFYGYISYFEKFVLEQPLMRPWLQVDLSSDKYKSCKDIPTTTNLETLQLLVWLVEQRKPKVSWEIGCWMGHATKLMAISSPSNTRVFAMDAFKLQNWMYNYLFDIETYRQRQGTSFLPIFEKNLVGFESKVKAVFWPYDITELPNTLKFYKPELIYMDITQEDEDLEAIWNIIKVVLIPNKTVIVFNGLARSSLPFFVRHAKELQAFAKPHTIAKAFLFVNQTQNTSQNLEIKQGRQVNFFNDANWDHHHDNLFEKAIDHLRNSLHDDQADVLFVSAVEQTLCDDPETLEQQPWIGIIHSVVKRPEYFYVPDLKRLCKRRTYIPALQKCKGLFTLTEFQAKYLKQHIPKDLLTFPIQILYYPIETKGRETIIQVPEMFSKGPFPIDVLHIGSYARDFDLFFRIKLPQKFRKVFVVSDEICEKAAKNAPVEVYISPRLSSEEYEGKIGSSIIFLSLKCDGAANTLLLECIARSLPILSPNYEACQQYLGSEYPLFYDPYGNLNTQMQELLKLEKIELAIAYLEHMDKYKFSYGNFLDNLNNGAVLKSIAPHKSSLHTTSADSFDVTISLCSYKRTHHLSTILEQLWNHQDFQGSFEILIWNNNECRNALVDDIAQKYIENPTSNKRLQIISSTENHYCVIRFALASLMKGKCLLICDDDVIPGENFISFFYSAYQQHPEDVLCFRGHIFLPHEMDTNHPELTWSEYENLRFKDDDQPEQLIHFVHADTCLIPKKALHEVASVEMPDPDFTLVDDYWMSFVLSHKFHRKLRKLCVLTENGNPPIVRAVDSDIPGLALHTRPETKDARLRMYIHHMQQGWPKWETEFEIASLSEKDALNLKAEKTGFRDTFYGIGWNISSLVTDEEIEILANMGTKLVRIGAVGVGGKTYFEFSNFLKKPDIQITELLILIEKLKKVGINVVLTLERRVATLEVWKLLAKNFRTFGNVVGYDIINEPFTEHEKNMDRADVEADAETDEGIAKVEAEYKQMIQAIRSVDVVTPIILEPTFWGTPVAIRKFPVKSLKDFDDNLIVSVHFYEPFKLTSRIQNKGRYSFPGEIPRKDGVKCFKTTLWNEQTIFEEIRCIKNWAVINNVKMFVGEFGICRDIKGAPDYLQSVVKACTFYKIPACIFSFRDNDWEAMDYEFGVDMGNYLRISEKDKNPFVSVIQEAMNT